MYLISPKGSLHFKYFRHFPLNHDFGGKSKGKGIPLQLPMESSAERDFSPPKMAWTCNEHVGANKKTFHLQQKERLKKTTRSQLEETEKKTEPENEKREKIKQT